MKAYSTSQKSKVLTRLLRKSSSGSGPGSGSGSGSGLDGESWTGDSDLTVLDETFLELAFLEQETEAGSRVALMEIKPSYFGTISESSFTSNHTNNKKSRMR